MLKVEIRASWGGQVVQVEYTRDLSQAQRFYEVAFNQNKIAVIVMVR